MSAAPRPRCQARTQSGTRCRLPAQAGSAYCHIHNRQAAPRRATAELMQESIQEGAQKLADESPLFTAEDVQRWLDIVLARLSPEWQEWLQEGLQHVLASEWFDLQTWEGIGYVLRALADTQLDFIKRRLRGEYDVDAWGYDPEFADLAMPVLGFFFQRFWRVELNGVEHIPNQGRALLVANHGGALPVDGVMLVYGIREHHPAHRLARGLVADWFPTVPFISTWLQRAGQVVAHPDNARRLLAAEELVLVFPEGIKGVSKPFRRRYELARFGRGGFVRTALENNAPIIPVAIVGSAESYPLLANVEPLARLLGLPTFPLTLTFPWLGPLGLLPFPSKWTIDILEPIDTASYDPAQAHNPALISELSNLVRQRIQDQINTRLAARQSIFRG